MPTHAGAIDLSRPGKRIGQFIYQHLTCLGHLVKTSQRGGGSLEDCQRAEGICLRGRLHHAFQGVHNELWCVCVCVCVYVLSRDVRLVVESTPTSCMFCSTVLKANTEDMVLVLGHQ